MPKSQAEINANKITELYLVINELEKKIDVMNDAILNLMDVMDKLTDRSKDIEMNIRYLYRRGGRLSILQQQTQRPGLRQLSQSMKSLKNESTSNISV